MLGKRTARAALAAALVGWGCLPAGAAPIDPEPKEPLKVLLTASAPVRDYQFLRTLLIRGMDKKQLELCIYLQPPPGQEKLRTGIVMDVPSDRLLERFPDHYSDLSKDKDEEKFLNLAAYNVLVAFDLDWSRLKKEQAAALRKWVEAGGGLVVVAGAINTGQLAGKPTDDAARAAADLLPVVVDKPRDKEEREKPFRLNFPGVKDRMSVLMLDPKGKGPTAGWEKFFTGRDKFDKDAEVVRGFYNYYPVKSVKSGATVLATYADPSAKLDDGSEQPFLVVGKQGMGRVLYLGSPELWRVRQLNEPMHERLCMQLLWYAAGVDHAPVK
jgi:hypothetical protein